MLRPLTEVDVPLKQVRGGIVGVILWLITQMPTLVRLSWRAQSWHS